jgi:hypothetical protein
MWGGCFNKKKIRVVAPLHHYSGRKRPNARKFTRKKWRASWLKAFKNKIINKFIVMRCLSFSKKNLLQKDRILGVDRSNQPLEPHITFSVTLCYYAIFKYFISLPFTFNDKTVLPNLSQGRLAALLSIWRLCALYTSHTWTARPCVRLCKNSNPISADN